MALAHVRHAELLGLVGPLAVAASLGPQIAARIRSAPPSAVGRAIVRMAAPAHLPAVALALVIAAATSLPVLLRPIERRDDPTTPLRRSPPPSRCGSKVPFSTARVLAVF
jgi:hypothetical protein